MGVDHGGLDIRVAHEIFDSRKINSIHHKMRSKGVAGWPWCWELHRVGAPELALGLVGLLSICLIRLVLIGHTPYR